MSEVNVRYIIDGVPAAVTFYTTHLGWQTKEQIRSTLEKRFGYDLHTSLNQIRPTYGFDETCQGTVPQAIVAFLESTSFEDAIRNAVSLGGDADTLACITGGIAEAYYGGVPEELAGPVRTLLDKRLLSVVDQFRERFPLERATHERYADHRTHPSDSKKQ